MGWSIAEQRSLNVYRPCAGRAWPEHRAAAGEPAPAVVLDGLFWTAGSYEKSDPGGTWVARENIGVRVAG